MAENDFRKAFGLRVKETRKNRKLTQKELAQKLGIHYQLLNKYEGGYILPQPEKIVTLADFLGVSVDFLLTGRTLENSDLSDVRLLGRFQVLSHFQKEDQDTILRIIDAISVRSTVQGSIEKISSVTGLVG